MTYEAEVRLYDERIMNYSVDATVRIQRRDNEGPCWFKDVSELSVLKIDYHNPTDHGFEDVTNQLDQATQDLIYGILGRKACDSNKIHNWRGES